MQISIIINHDESFTPFTFFDYMHFNVIAMMSRSPKSTIMMSNSFLGSSLLGVPTTNKLDDLVA